MASSRIASRYSKSLFDIANEKGSMEDVKSDMDLIAQTLKDSRDLKNLLKNPIVSIKDKQAVLQKVFASCSQGTRDFLNYLVEKKREAELPLVAQQFVDSYDQMKGIARATVISALPLNEDTMDKVRSYVKGMTGTSEIELTNKVDASIIGGIVIEHEDKRLDMSVARELREIRKELIYN